LWASVLIFDVIEGRSSNARRRVFSGAISDFVRRGKGLGHRMANLTIFTLESIFFLSEMSLAAI
jgi:hypothetical protein